jgi:hypothetical protein
MKPLDIAGMVPFGAPVGWNKATDGPCHSLPVWRDGRAHTSVWEFTDAERAQVAAGHNFVLVFHGGQPPVRLSVDPISIKPLIVPDLDPPAQPPGFWKRFRHFFFWSPCEGDHHCSMCDRVMR